MEAIMALCALAAAYAVIIAAVSAIGQGYESAGHSINAKEKTLECAAIIDSLASNGAEQYEHAFGCDANKITVSFTEGEKTKTSQTLANAEKKLWGISVESSHYK